MAATIPADLLDIFAEPALGHVAYRASNGHLAIFPMWVAYDGEHLLTSTPVGARKARVLEQPGAEVAVSIVSAASPWRYLSLTGHVVGVRPDEGLAFIDEQSQRFTGGPYRVRDRAREVFTIELDRVMARTGRG